MNDKRFQKKLEKMRKKCERQKAKSELEAQYAEYYPHRAGKKVSNVMLTVIVVMIVLYVAADFVLQLVTGTEISSTITTCWFAFWTVEILALAGIKVSKVRNSSYEDEMDL